MKLRGALLAATMLAMPVVASAQPPVTGLYISLDAGLNVLQDQTVKSLDGAAVSGGKVKSNLGEAALGSIGWGFGNGLRAELEFDYRYNSLTSFTSPSGSLTIGGAEQKFGPMVNVLYDFNGLTPRIVPYVGAGIGYQFAYDTFSSGSGSASDTAGALAYQAIVGAALPIESTPGLALTAEYRFMGLAGDRKYTSGGTSLKLGDDFNHSFLVGIRYNFGQVPPPAPAPAPKPVPAPMVQPARSYLVFFDWDKATLTNRARQIIHQAAENSTHVRYTRIVVNGYTDTSGPAAYNMKLSIRRADAVAAELVRDGVSRNVISIHGFGETHLLVPTGPNVREAQNRRVEIIIR